MSTHVWWYVARTSGMVAWLLLTASVVWGIWLSTRRPGTTPRPNWLLDLHRWLGGLAVSFTFVHLGGLVLDGFVDFTVGNLLIPLSTDWHPVAVAWGIVAFYLLVAVEVTSLLRTRLSRRFWRGIHLTSFGLFWMASIHGMAAGTDRQSSLFPVLALVGMVAVALGTVHRLGLGRRREVTRRRVRNVEPSDASWG